jgi:hypothetical protein
MEQFNIDLSGLEADQLLESTEAADAQLEEDQALEAQQQQNIADENAQAEADANLKGNDRKLPDSDPRSDGVGFNLPDIAAEVGSALTGGARDTVSSGLTFAERAGDMISGEANEPDYDGPDWKPLSGDKNPITKTWWGNFLRGGVHFATMAGGLVLAAKGAAALPFVGGVAAAGMGKFAALGKLGVAGKLGQGAIAGAASDVVSEYSQDENAMGALAKRFPQLDNPLATKDTDSPAMKTFKNVVEGMGIGMVADGMFMMIKKARGGAMAPVEELAEEAAESQKINSRNADVDAQKTEMGIRQMESPEFGAYKNEPIADPWQGSPTSRAADVDDAMKQRTRMEDEWLGNDSGSMDSLTTPAQLSRSADIAEMPVNELNRFYEETLGSEALGRLNETLRQGNLNPDTVLREAYVSMKGFQQMVEGRNGGDIPVEEYFEKLIGSPEAAKLTLDSGIGQKIVLMDLINASNTKQIRDMGIGAREINDVADVLDSDGPVSTMVERLRYGIEQVKTARYLWGQIGRNMQTPEGVERSAEQFFLNKLKESDLEVIRDIKTEANDATKAMLQFLQRSKDSANTEAILEAFSMAGGPNTLDDLYKYFVSKLKGGDWNGMGTSRLIKELQGVMVHSVLSGPKTPVRAIMGTATATTLRPLTQALGGAMFMDGPMLREGLAGLNALRQSLPEAFGLFKSKLNSYWSGEIATTGVRNFEFDPREQEWDAISQMMEMKGDDASMGEQMAFRIASVARGMNNTNLLTYSTKLMKSTDDAFGFIMARVRARQKALRQAMDNQNPGAAIEVTPAMLKEYEERFMAEFLDPEGNVNFDTDAALNFARQEATLTRDLSGFAAGLDQLAAKTPWVKPFIMFTKTGINGLELGLKHTPGFNALIKDERVVFNATAEMADKGELANIGITNAADLMQAKAIQKGRMAMGGAITTMAAMHFMDGNLTGNGPQDRQQRQMWIDAGWKPRSINLGGTWVSYDSFEPFNMMLSHIADIGDHYDLMGPEWTEKSLMKTALVMSQGVTSKSYMAGLQQFVDLFSMQPGQAERMIASLANNQIPLSSMRNELGKLFNPHMKELQSGFEDSIRNRNQLSEALSGEPLPTKYDFLTGKPINDWSFPTRMFNMISPVQFNLDYSPGKKLLFDSGYDLRVSAYATPTGVSLKDTPEVRSLYQQAMGKQNLQAKLDKLAKQPKVIESLAQMEKDRNAGRYGNDPKDYHHNKVIFTLFSDVQKRAWASIQDDPRVQQLVEAQRLGSATSEAIGRGQYGGAARTYEQAQELLNMAK